MSDQPDGGPDYVFRYPLRPRPEDPALHAHPVTELLRAQLAHLLDVLVPTSRGREVRIDGFRLLNDPHRVYGLFPEAPPADTAPPPAGFQDPRNAALYEPRIDLIRKHLQSLLSVVELERSGRTVSPDGFHLRCLEDWLVPSSGDPSEVFACAGTRCDADCVFCYNKGNPPSLALQSPGRSRRDERREMMTRLRYLSQTAALFPTLGSTYEVLAHPRILEVLRALRSKTAAVFRLTTDGSTLTRERVASLAALRPVYIYLSLNSALPERRRKLMKVRRPRTAIDALRLLREHQVPCATVIVPWPEPSIESMLEDLSATVAYADRHDTHLVQVNLPGFSAYHSSDGLFDLEEVWSAVVRLVRDLRPRTRAPIVVMPAMYEENLHQPRKNRALVIGVVANSPAARAGIRQGDEIRSVGGLAVSSRPQARRLLARLRDHGAGPASIAIARGGRQLALALDPRLGSHPYSEHDRHLGVVMMGTGLEPGCLEKLRDLIHAARARLVLFLSSALVRPALEQALAESPLLSGVKIDIRVPPSRYFGGNIFMGDLLVVQDFIDCIREYLEESGDRPDLVVIPSSPFHLGAWRRDLTGRVYLEIERAVGVPVELMDCETIYE